MVTVLHLCLAWALVLIMNVIPAFMPPTWSVLAVLHLHNHLPLLPLTVGGATAATAGRTMLARLSRWAGGHLPERDRANAVALATFLERHPRWQDAIVFGYCLGPLPSNALFIAAGIGRLRLRRVAVIFLVSRALGDTFWVWTATGITRSVGDVFAGALTSPRSLAAQAVSAGLIAAACRLPWATWLGEAASAHGRTPPHLQPPECGSDAAWLHHEMRTEMNLMNAETVTTDGVEFDMPVRSMDGVKLGSVKEIRAESFQLNAPHRPDYWLRGTAIQQITPDGIIVRFISLDRPYYEIADIDDPYA